MVLHYKKTCQATMNNCLLLMGIKYFKKSKTAPFLKMLNTSNHMFGRIIWDKLPITGNFKNFKNHDGDLSHKSPESNMWLLVNHTLYSQTFCI